LSTEVTVCDDFFNCNIPTVKVVRSHYSVPYCTQSLTTVKLHTLKHSSVSVFNDTNLGHARTHSGYQKSAAKLASVPHLWCGKLGSRCRHGCYYGQIHVRLLSQVSMVLFLLFSFKFFLSLIRTFHFTDRRFAVGRCLSVHQSTAFTNCI